MKRLYILCTLLCLPLAVASCALEQSELDTASNASTSALDSIGAAYIASIEQAEMEIMAQVIYPPVQALAFSGNTIGSNGIAAWDGTIDETANLQADYTITFTDYAADQGGIEVTGEVAVAVSQTAQGCSATWNFSDLELVDPLNLDLFFLDSVGSGLILSGNACDILSVTGKLDVSGDAVGNDCSVSGTTASPNVDC